MEDKDFSRYWACFAVYEIEAILRAISEGQSEFIQITKAFLASAFGFFGFRPLGIRIPLGLGTGDSIQVSLRRLLQHSSFAIDQAEQT